jgi:hypothetical protein
MKASKALSIVLILLAFFIFLHQYLLFGQIFSLDDVGDFFVTQHWHHEVLMIFSLIGAFLVYKISDDFKKW